MRKLSHDEIAKSRSTIETLYKVNKLPVIVLLNSIRSTYNVGSIFRTSDGAMIEELILCGYTPYPPHQSLPGGKKEILKTALGATNSIKWQYAEDPLDVIKKLKKRGIKICALELTSESKPYYNLSKDIFPVCMVIGNEISGVSQEILNECDFSIEIPQYGIKQSLNVAVAYGIAIFELRKIFDNQISSIKPQQ